jgi:hypothetical protein
MVAIGPLIRTDIWCIINNPWTYRQSDNFLIRLPTHRQVVQVNVWQVVQVNVPSPTNDHCFHAVSTIIRVRATHVNYQNILHIQGTTPSIKDRRCYCDRITSGRGLSPGSTWAILGEARTQSTHISTIPYIEVLVKCITDLVHVLIMQRRFEAKITLQRINQSLRKRFLSTARTSSLP